MEIVYIINLVLSLTITVLFAYKMFLFFLGIFGKKKFESAKTNHSFAILIAGRNEEKVIGRLIESIKAQAYDSSLVKIFIVADNCTDSTANVARLMNEQGGAEVVVFERFNTQFVGKGYALDFLLSKIENQMPDYHPDAYIIFDADNLLDKNYLFEMNKVLDSGYEISTSYRNSKNFTKNWISATSAMNFLRECRFIHTPRAIIGSSTFVSGTGFMVSSKILNTKTGWKYTTLTEDIEFSASSIAKGKKITYCDDAIFYDEQPESVKASWNQRMRWQKGFYQCFNKYFVVLLASLFSKHWFANYEMMLTLFPFTAVTFSWGVFYLIFNFVHSLLFRISPILVSPIASVITSSLTLFVISFFVLFFYGFFILLVERKRVKTKFFQKLWYSLMFPIYVYSYIPIAIVCIFKRVKWKQIPHTDSRGIKDIEKGKSK